ncbi:MAG: lipoyl(octanoyl) transferase LipB [Bacillota bacterium]
MSINVVDLGKMQYGEALEIQEHLLARRQANEIGDTLLLVEHPPTLTLGTRGQYSNILASESQLAQNGIEVFEVNRGGDVTYHGPGQIVGYPIMNIACVENDIKRFIWNLEEVIIRILDAEYGITAMREDKAYTGVWVGDMKVCAIGIAVKKYVTMHGFALNANTNLEDFKLINPCGITDRGVTSLRALTGVEQNLMELKLKVANYFCQVFERNMKPAKLSDLLPD